MNISNITDIVKMEVGGIYGFNHMKELNEIINLYDIYDKGQDWNVDQADYIPTKKKTNYIKKLIKEEARFLFGKTPIFKIATENGNNEEKCLEIERFINQTLKENLFDSKLVKGARDCFIGKRVAIKLHADKINKKIRIMFVPSFGFIYEPFEDKNDELKKIIFIHEVTNGVDDKAQQVFWKQKYEMVNGKCILDEGYYNGYGNLIEKLVDNIDLGLSGIPAYVVLNDGLSGDLNGESDVAEIMDNQLAYNKLSSEDIDTLTRGMNRIIYGIDIEDTSKFRLAPGAYWDIETSSLKNDKQASIGTVETDFNYNERMQNKLAELRQDMYEMLNIPNISLDTLKGFATSGKGMKALYWNLITRCEEKMSDWRPALEWLVLAILEMANVYNVTNIPQIKDMIVMIENQYPLQEDEDAEKTLDMQQVSSQVMSRKAYINKWFEVDSDEELKQIQLERQMLEDNFIEDVIVNE